MKCIFSHFIFPFLFVMDIDIFSAAAYGEYETINELLQNVQLLLFHLYSLQIQIFW